LTPGDRVLDVEALIQHQPITLYRLTKAEYANLSGVGAALEPGRWNRLGTEAIYTSTQLGVPLLERLAHTPKDQIPCNLALMKIRIDGNWQRETLDKW
jgi:RES domain-containing protein